MYPWTAEIIGSVTFSEYETVLFESRKLVPSRNGYECYTVDFSSSYKEGDMLLQNAYTSWSFPQGGLNYLFPGHKGAPSASIRLCTRGDNDHKHASASPPDNTPSQAVYGPPPDPIPLARVHIRSRIRALTGRQPNMLRYRPHSTHASWLGYSVRNT